MKPLLDPRTRGLVLGNPELPNQPQRIGLKLKYMNSLTRLSRETLLKRKTSKVLKGTEIPQKSNSIVEVQAWEGLRVLNQLDG